jgi:hypothetical protein
MKLKCKTDYKVIPYQSSNENRTCQRWHQDNFVDSKSDITLLSQDDSYYKCELKTIVYIDKRYECWFDIIKSYELFNNEFECVSSLIGFKSEKDFIKMVFCAAKQNVIVIEAVKANQNELNFVICLLNNEKIYFTYSDFIRCFKKREK